MTLLVRSQQIFLQIRSLQDTEVMDVHCKAHNSKWFGIIVAKKKKIPAVLGCVHISHDDVLSGWLINPCVQLRVSCTLCFRDQLHTKWFLIVDNKNFVLHLTWVISSFMLAHATVQDYIVSHLLQNCWFKNVCFSRIELTLETHTTHFWIDNFEANGLPQWWIH